MMKPTISILAALALGACSKSQDQPSNSTADNGAAAIDAADTHQDVQLGELTIQKDHDDAGHLLYNGKPLSPPIEGNTLLSIEHVYRFPTKKLYLVQDIGGTACPATYYVVAVTAAGATASKDFGTCSDLVKVTQVPGGLSIRMPGYVSAEQLEMDPTSNDDAEHVFTYRDGRISERKVLPVSSVRITPTWLAGYWVGAAKPTADLECGTDTGVQFTATARSAMGGTPVASAPMVEP